MACRFGVRGVMTAVFREHIEEVQSRENVAGCFRNMS